MAPICVEDSWRCPLDRESGILPLSHCAFTKGLRRQIHPGWSRSQRGVAKRHIDESRRNCGNHKKAFPALSRWALSYNLRSQIAAAARKMFALGLDDQVETNLSCQMSWHVKLKELPGWSSMVKPEWSHSESHQVLVAHFGDLADTFFVECVL